MKQASEDRVETAWFLTESVAGCPGNVGDLLLFELKTKSEDGQSKHFKIDEEGIVILPDQARLTAENKTPMGRFLFTSVNGEHPEILRLCAGRTVLLLPVNRSDTKERVLRALLSSEARMRALPANSFPPEKIDG